MKFDHLVCLVLMRRSDGGWIFVAEVPVRDSLSEAVPFRYPILEATLLPFSLVLWCYPARQLRRQYSGVTIDVFEQTSVPHPMKAPKDRDCLGRTRSFLLERDCCRESVRGAPGGRPLVVIISFKCLLRHV